MLRIAVASSARTASTCSVTCDTPAPPDGSSSIMRRSEAVTTSVISESRNGSTRAASDG